MRRCERPFSDSLRELNREYGMSIVYITHDLTTAYQISDNIIVLYRGAVSEAGDVDLVVGQPRHPYTQLLIDSVPEPDPEHHWGAARINGAGHVAPPAAANGHVAQQHHLSSCPFADRCPQVMSIC